MRACELVEADRRDGFFFEPHDSDVPDPALRCAADCGEQREPLNAAVVAARDEPSDDADFEGLVGNSMQMGIKLAKPARSGRLAEGWADWTSPCILVSNMSNDPQYGRTLFVEHFKVGASAKALTRISFSKRAFEGAPW